MVFPAIHDFSDFRAISVAVSRHGCRVLATVGFSVGLAVLAGCATTSQTGARATPQAVEAKVSERAKARWDAVIKDDMAAAYGYLSPASREAVSLEKYKSTPRRTGFREAKVEEVRCEAEVCYVKLLVTYDHARMKGITTPIVESWIVDGGQVWYVYGNK